MPLYEYKCSSCGHQQEFLQKWSDAPMKVCTACGKETFAKMLTAAGFQLKGSGWYATDFKNSGSKSASTLPAKAATTSDTPKSDTSKSDTSKSDTSKSETKSSGGGESKKDASPPASGSGGTAATS
jgi:putative FmdB family regulatory protein